MILVERAVTKIDDRGRILIPKKIRDKLMLKEGDTLTLEIVDGKVILSPIHRPKKVRARSLEEAFFDAGEATFGD